MKKFLASLFVAALLAVPSVAYPFWNWCDMCLTPYVGIAGGVSIPVDRSHTTEDIFGSDFRHHGGRTGGLIGGVAGVQTFFCNNVYVAVQANALYHATGRVEHRHFDGSTAFAYHHHLRNHFQWGIDARLGMSFCGATPYILGGFESGSWRFKFENDTVGVLAGPGFSRHETLWGGKLGAGVTFPICCCLWGNIEYSYIWWGSLRHNFFNPATGNTWHHRHDIRQNTVLFGLNYLF